MSHSSKIYPNTQKAKTAWPIMTYDHPRYKSPEYLVYQAARAKNDQEAKIFWKRFLDQATIEHLSKAQKKVLIHSLDDRKQWAPIHYAVQHNNYYVFSQLTAANSQFRCDINLNTGNGENVLHIAARSDHFWQARLPKFNRTIEGTPQELVQSTAYCIDLLVGTRPPQMVYDMLSLGADVNDQDDEGQTPLHLAVKHNRYDYAEILIERGADLMATTKLKLTVLYFALLPNEATSDDSDQRPKMIKLIFRHTDRIGKTEHLLNLITMDNQISFARALSHPVVSKELVEILINKGPQMNERQVLTACDMLLRYHCSSENFLKYVKLVLNSLKTEHIHQFLCIIVRHNNRLLLERIYKEVIENSPKMEKQLKNERKSSYGGYSVLLTAVFYNSKECVQYLLEQKNSTNDHEQLLDTNDNNENILHICAKRHVDKELFDIIWKKIGDTSIYNYKNQLINMHDVEDKLPIEVAARFKVRYFCETLFKDSSKNILLMKRKAAYEASEAGHLDILKSIFHDNSKDRSQQSFSKGWSDILPKRNENEYTCLHLAARQGHEEIVDFLINKVKIEVDPIGARHVTPLHLACQNGHVAVLEILLKAGASTTFRNAQVYNCLEIAIMNQHKNIVEKLFQQSTWSEMMQNAQPIEGTEAFDTPMRKLIRYMPDMAVWFIDNKLTKVVGGPGQKIYKKIYDYEFYEDAHRVSDWYIQGATIQFEPKPYADLWRYRGVEALYTCFCCCHSDNIECLSCCCRQKQNEEENKKQRYIKHVFTFVRNHPLFVVSQQKNCPDLVKHDYHIQLRQAKFRPFGLPLFISTFLLYVVYLTLYTAVILMGKHPKYFYDQVNISMTSDLSTCESVSNLMLNNPDFRNEALKTETYRRIKNTIYVILIIFIVKNTLTILLLFPRVLRCGAYYIEISAMVLSYVYILDWFSWQDNVLFRCPVQYQIGAMGILLGYLNFLLYLRTTPVFNVGIYVVMLQVISGKFLRFLPVLLVIICGFGFTYWMLLQYQSVYGTPIEAILRTSLMIFDLGYEDRLYDKENGGIGYYTLVYVIFMLTAIACSIFVINLLIGLAVGEIPTLLTQGTLWHIDILFTLLSDYEILRLRWIGVFHTLTCHKFRHHQIPWITPRLFLSIEKDELDDPMVIIEKLGNYTV